MHSNDITALKARCKAIEQENSMLLKTIKGIELDMEDVLRLSRELRRSTNLINQIVQYIAKRDGVSESEVAFS